MINRKKTMRKSIETQSVKSGFIKWLQEQVISTNQNLSDNYCLFYIKDTYQMRGSNIIIEIYCQPTSGVFQGIQFRPKIFINSINLVQRPKIYNDRRIFHPNINAYTCQIISKQLVLDWNPTIQYPPLYQRFCAILRHLKYLIIEPNCYFVPNNHFNCKAAWNYHFNKNNYRNLIEKNCPLYLDNVISGELNYSTYVQMDIENQSLSEIIEKKEDYWGVDKIMIKKTLPTVQESFDINKQDQQNFDLLAKKIKYIDFEVSQSLVTSQIKRSHDQFQ